MHDRQIDLSRLYDALLEHDGDAVDDVVLRPWLAENPDRLTDLVAIAGRMRYPDQGLPVEDLWVLYAVLRIVERLQDALISDRLSLPAYRGFTGAIGLSEIQPHPFHPMFHEIVSVTQTDDPDATAMIEDTLWPGMQLGPLILSRSGVALQAGEHHVDKQLAEGSTLYWANFRGHRPVEDRSHGWGHNSQWRTEIRQDFIHGDRAYFNAFAQGAEDPSIPKDEAVSLVRHRCTICRPSSSPEPYPYNTSVTEPYSPDATFVGKHCG